MRAKDVNSKFNLDSNETSVEKMRYQTYCRTDNTYSAQEPFGGY